MTRLNGGLNIKRRKHQDFPPLPFDLDFPAVMGRAMECRLGRMSDLKKDQGGCLLDRRISV
ncbi:MAG: hypothetical protein MUF86_02935 [Akkermansiaceae bacterium]|jgi:hypothetical protein|nr:hypothetical protein [Akkermansiaceae bacterium]